MCEKYSASCGKIACIGYIGGWFLSVVNRLDYLQMAANSGTLDILFGILENTLKEESTFNSPV